MADDRFTIETPEHVALSYELAGPGARMIAALIDHLIIGLVVSAIFLLASAVHTTAPGGTVLAVIVGGPLLLLAAYFSLFEAIWNGQTPGKRAAGIRVMNDDGTPAGFLGIVIRNTVRIVDFLPYFYFLGGFVSFFQRHGKRLGDLAAGTVVVKLRDREMPDLSAPPPVTGEAGHDLVRQLRTAARMVSPSELGGIRRFLARRYELEPEVRRQLARQMLTAVADKLPAEHAAPQAHDPEAVLEALAKACAETGERF